MEAADSVCCCVQYDMLWNATSELGAPLNETKDDLMLQLGNGDASMEKSCHKIIGHLLPPTPSI